MLNTLWAMHEPARVSMFDVARRMMAGGEFFAGRKPRQHWAAGFPQSIGIRPEWPPERERDPDSPDGSGDPLRLNAGPQFQTRPDAPGVAILSIRGPIFRDATFINYLMADIFGGTILEWWAQAFGAAASDPAIEAILLDINSPGGEAWGITEMARRIRATNDGAGGIPPKPVVAYCDGLMASAAYYLGSAAGKIISTPQSLIGCIGTMFCIMDDSEYLKMNGFQEIIITSDDAPNKYADPKTDRGKLQYREEANDLQAEFRMDVSRFRGVSEAIVMDDFGGGAVLGGRDAKRVGMIDELGDFESLLAATATQVAAARVAREEAARAEAERQREQQRKSGGPFRAARSLMTVPKSLALVTGDGPGSHALCPGRSLASLTPAPTIPIGS